MEEVNLNAHLQLSRCPHCSTAHPTLEQKTHFVTFSVTGRQRLWAVYVCTTCGGVTSAWAQKERGRVFEYFPGVTVTDASVPDPARSYLNQARESLSAPAGSIMLSASAVDAMLKLKGLTEGTLYTRIEMAAEQHVITGGMKDWAHKVRLDANGQRHADDDFGLPDVHDAQHTLQFAAALAEFLFVLPERVARGIAGDPPPTEEGTPGQS